MKYKNSVKAALLSVCLLAFGAEVEASGPQLCVRSYTLLSEVWLGAPDDMISFTVHRKAENFKVKALMREAEPQEYTCELIISGDDDSSNGIRCSSYSQELLNLKKGVMIRSINARRCDITKDSERDKDEGVPNQLSYVSSCKTVGISVLENEKGVEKYSHDLDNPMPRVEFYEWKSYYHCNAEFPSEVY